MTDPYTSGVPQDAPAGYPAPGAFSDYSGRAVPQRPTTPTLGWVALAAGAVALIGSVVNALVIFQIFTPENLDGDASTAVVAMAFGLTNGLMIWFGFGLWAIIQGLVALGMKRGVVQGVVGAILGLIGPWTGVILAAILFTQRFPTT